MGLVGAVFAVFLALVVFFALVGAAWELVSFAIVGLILGGLARLILPGRQPIGALSTILSGLIGSIVGGLIGHAVDVGRLATVLLEIGVAVVAVGSFSAAASRRELGGPGDHRQIR